MTNTLIITKPDDWHLHVRNKDILNTVIPHTAREFSRALIMPNLNPPVTTVSQATHYYNEIVAATPVGLHFEPMMSLYLTDNTSTEDVREAAEANHVLGFKLYPAGATTNSASGVTQISRIMPALEAMAAHQVVLQVHGEVTDPHVDIFDREAEFIDQILNPLCRELPELKIVLEHITTQEGVEFVKETPNVAATITVHHLMYSRNELFKGGIRPHYYCLPILKREKHRQALLEAATSGSKHFFLGTDSAPHTRKTKENHCGCAGIYTAHAALPLYAEVFEAMGQLDRLESFSAHHGADFYGIQRNTEQVTLTRSPHTIPDSYSINSDDEIIPLCAGESITWSVQ